MNREREIRAVLLDMDGTLLDTETVNLESTIAALHACGYGGDHLALCQSMIGIPGPECDLLMRRHFGETFLFADVDKAFAVRREEILRAGIPLKSGAVDLVAALRQAGYPLAVVTSSSRRTAERYLTRTGLHSNFTLVVTRDDVARGKPSPDLYLLAARRFGLPPRHCLAIEDSNPGVAAAVAAGAVTIMVPDLLPPTDASRAACMAVLPDLAAVIARLRTCGVLKPS